MEKHFSSLQICSVVLCITLSGGIATAASSRDTWRWDDILESPLIEADRAQCSATHPVLNVPNFGNGLIATYGFDIDDNVGDPASKIEYLNSRANQDRHAASSDPGSGLAFPKKLPHGPAEITADDNVVLNSMDDLLNRYEWVCQSSRDPGLLLRSITYRHASLRERAEAPRRENWYMAEQPFQPVRITPASGIPDFLPEAVPGGDFRFSTAKQGVENTSGVLPLEPPLGWSLDTSKIQYGNGVHIAALFVGHTYLESLGRMIDAGFEPMTIKHAGQIETLVIDPTVLKTDDELRERTKRLIWDGLSVRLDLRGIRLMFFPADHGAIEALRGVPTDELKEQLTAVQAQLAAEELTKEKRPPDEAEVEKIVSSQWLRFADAPQGPGYDALFGRPGTIFGHLQPYELKCEPAPPGVAQTVFTCIVSVTFVDDGHPKYQKRTLLFDRAREPDQVRGHHDYRPLSRHDPPAPTPDPLAALSSIGPDRVADGPDTPPSISEIEQLLKRGWKHVSKTDLAGEVQQHAADLSFSELVADKDSSFGEVHDLQCSEQDKVFSCEIGATFMRAREPEYERRNLTFSRVHSDKGLWELKYYIVPEIIVSTNPDKQKLGG